MAQEDSQAMQFLVLLGQVVMPIGREAIMLALRGLGKAVSTVVPAGARLVADHVDGFGSKGIVGSRAMRGVPTQVVDITKDSLGREDLRRLRDLCAKNGVGFSIVRANDGPFGIEFKAEDADFMRSAMLKVARDLGVSQDRIDHVADVCPEPLPGQRPQAFNREGVRWEPVESSGGVHTFAASVGEGADAHGVRAATDGAWSVSDASGKVVERGEGAGDLFDSTARGVARARTLSDPKVMRENAAIPALRPSDRSEAMESRDMTAAEVMSKAEHHGASRGGHAHTRTASRHHAAPKVTRR